MVSPREGGHLAKTKNRETSQVRSEEDIRPERVPERVPNPLTVWPIYLSSLFLWFSHPPFNLGWLAWIAPVGYLWFAEQSLTTARFGAREWLHGWLAGCLFWLPILQGIRLAFWPLYAGWLALALYLAIYTPLFLYGLRNLRRRGLPLLLAAPLLWVGLEYIRSYMLTGYSASMLSHTQVHLTPMIQIADMLGAYGISGLVMSVAVAAYSLWVYGLAVLRKAEHRPALRTLLAVVAVLALVSGNFTYGQWRLSQVQEVNKEPAFRALLLQENTPSMFDATTSQDREDAWNSYLALAVAEIEEHGAVDLIVWPESTFTSNLPWYDPTIPAKLPPELRAAKIDLEMLKQGIRQSNLEFINKCRKVLNRVGNQLASQGKPVQLPFLLVGCDVLGVREDEQVHYNSGLWIDPSGSVVGQYSKMHLVVFGEFMPWGFEWLGDSFDFWGAKAGDEPKCFEVGDARLAPNICFETMMPRVVQSQVAELTRAGRAPDVLVNLTNDSWFRGSSMLDHHLACTILCAVENRRPVLVAANTGISAEINGSGELLQEIDRSQAGGILASPQRDGRWGLVQAFGYPLGWLGAILVLLSGWPVKNPTQSTNEERTTDVASD